MYIIREVEGSLYRVAKGILYSDMDCADAIQETIIKAYSSIEGLKNEKYFKTWITRILINKCRDLLATKKKVVPVYEINEGVVDLNISQKIEVWEAIQNLKEEMRVVIILYYIEGWSLKETAELLDIAEGTVKSRLARARVQLASYFDHPMEQRGV
ncbi:sigma-70 family RNA polymerase sigma factor [Ammoniphilus sp. CFH 90114]|nr:sigma-70 family RNA polymerase sigma factor [Ammoniphilus sp. CFH 90114]